MILNIFSSFKKETMTNVKKHKTKTENGTYSSNMFCAIVMDIY